MPTSTAQNRAVKKYQDKNYDKFITTVKKGQKFEIQAHAKAQGESLDGFIKRAIAETMERDNQAPNQQ